MVKKILIADDEPDLLRIVQLRLMKKGYEIVLACDGQEALKMAQTQKPDLVLLDYRMPYQNGSEVCQSLKSDESLKKIPVILMTASPQELMEARLRPHGPDDEITKPFETDDLLSKIQRWISLENT